MKEAEWYERFDKMFGDWDGRLRRKIGEVFGAAGPIADRRLWEPIFCANCGKAEGYVTKGTPIVRLCNDCFQKHGHLPLPLVPGTEGD